MAKQPAPLLTLPGDILCNVANELKAADVAALKASCSYMRDTCAPSGGRNRQDNTINSLALATVSLRVTAPTSAIPIATPSQSHPQCASSHMAKDSLASCSGPITGQFELSQIERDPSSVSSSPASGNGFDSHASSDTELTTPEEDEWVFELTPEIIHRLGKLPRRKQRATLPGLPTELQCEIFSYLDQIDATCLGLTSRRTYTIYRSIHGVGIPLNTRRQGPNLLERAWEVVGRQQCAQCGIYRCELYQHIKTWMPADMEYCSFKLKFGTKAEDGVAANCYRGKPSKPRRCGRHPLRTTSVHQDDSLAMQAAQ